jgi:hypothetical protein
MNQIEKQTIAGQVKRLHIVWQALIRDIKRTDWLMVLVVLDVIAWIGSLVIAAWAAETHEWLIMGWNLVNATTCIINFRNLWFLRNNW